MLDPVSPFARDSHSSVLRVALASLSYVRDLVRLTAGEGDLVEALACTTALDANMAPVDRDAHLTVAYGRLDESAPDELRRPVSINSVAQSLGLPFETVRRRFARLAERGLSVPTPAGVIIPRSAVTSAAYNQLQMARYERTKELFLELRAADLIDAPDRTSEPPRDPLVRAANRVVSEYALRICPALVDLTGNMISSVVLIELTLQNIADLDVSQRHAWATAPARHGQPRRTVELTQDLSLSRETVRRHLQLLEDAGFCARDRRGFVAAAGGEGVWRVLYLAQSNDADLRRMFGRLARLGVLAGWEGDRGAHDLGNAAFAENTAARD